MILRFLSSIYFALILISLSAVWVIIGTFLESKFTSHALAENWIYHHPLFNLLLAGYFINILFSALRRWPFQKKHIPFLITHLGLLMLISGVFIKTQFGLQGHVQLIEGSTTDALIIPHEKALWITQKSPAYSASIPLHYSYLDGWKFKSSEIQLKKFHNHAKELYTAWIDQDHLSIWGLPILPIKLLDISQYPFKLWGTLEPISSVLKELEQQEKPFLIIHQNKNRDVSFLMGDGYGILFSENFSADRLKRWISYDDGYLGYSVTAEIPVIDRKNQIIKELSTHNQFSPPIELFRNASQVALKDFSVNFTNYLKDWADQKSWLSETPSQAFFSELTQLPWQNLAANEFKALYWIATLFCEKDFLNELKRKNWPIIAPLEEISQQFLERQEKNRLLFLTWMKQIYEIKELLPEVPTASITPQLASKMLSAFLRLYQVHYKDIPPMQEKSISLESPLQRTISLLDPPIKPEDATPCINIHLLGKSIDLVYDSEGNHLQWPLGDGNTLLSFRNHRVTLPYDLRLHHASDIKYPGSEQTFSYECLLSIRSKKTEKWSKCTLKMNQVFETAEGFRFYLSGMGNIDDFGVKNIQLVVNYDPAKYILTYPGGALVALGIILLFWRNAKKG